MLHWCKTVYKILHWCKGARRCCETSGLLIVPPTTASPVKIFIFTKNRFEFHASRKKGEGKQGSQSPCGEIIGSAVAGEGG